jgi:hypothetical protein
LRQIKATARTLADVLNNAICLNLFPPQANMGVGIGTGTFKAVQIIVGKKP